MVIEAIVLFAGFKFITGGAKNANAADLTVPDKTKVDGEKGGASVTQTVAGGTNGSGNTTTPFTPQQMNVSGGTQGNRLTWVQRR